VITKQSANITVIPHHTVQVARSDSAWACDRYFAAKFPKMLITVYDFAQTYCMDDPTYTWNLPVPVILPRTGQQSAADLQFVPQSLSAAAGSKEYQPDRFAFQLRADAESFAPCSNMSQVRFACIVGSIAVSRHVATVLLMCHALLILSKCLIVHDADVTI